MATRTDLVKATLWYVSEASPVMETQLMWKGILPSNTLSTKQTTLVTT